MRRAICTPPVAGFAPVIVLTGEVLVGRWGLGAGLRKDRRIAERPILAARFCSVDTAVPRGCIVGPGGSQGVNMQRLVAFSLSIALIVGAGAALMVADFDSRSTPADAPLPMVAVVFTGQYDRIETGLSLMQTGKINRLLVSGVNGKAGLDVTTFAEQFDLSPLLRDALASDRITLASGAGTTLENALETACWLAANPGIRHIALITSARHMPRASLALERAIAGAIEVRRTPSDDEGPLSARSHWAAEFPKFVGTWLITALAKRFWPGEEKYRCPSS